MCVPGLTLSGSSAGSGLATLSSKVAHTPRVTLPNSSPASSFHTVLLFLPKKAIFISEPQRAHTTLIFNRTFKSGSALNSFFAMRILHELKVNNLTPNSAFLSHLWSPWQLTIKLLKTLQKSRFSNEDCTLYRKDVLIILTVLWM